MPSALATHTRQRQREAIRRADSVADHAELAIHAWWRDLLALVKAGPQLGVTRLHAAALAHYRRLPGLTRQALRDGLTDLWRWGAESAQRGIPRAVLRRAVNDRGGLSSVSGRLYGARVPFLDSIRVPMRATVGAGRAVLEDRASDALRDFLFSSGLTDLPALPEDIPDDLLRSLVLPTPPLAVIQQRVDRLIAPFLAAPRPDLVDPQRFAAQLVTSYSQGKTLDEIAKDLLPTAEGVRASARRVARTWGTEIANQSQWEAHESLGPDLVIGYEVMSALRTSSRQWHKDRHGVTYYRTPGPGQKGFAQMPNPPREPADPSERPPGTPWIAWNCLLPGQYVQGRFLNGFKAWYSGEAVQLSSALGFSIRVTANHPVLTPDGFILAHKLRQGDCVGSYVARIDLTQTEQDKPIPVEQVFGALAQLSGPVATRPAGAEEFHGDAVRFKGDVEIVRPYGKLAGDVIAEGSQGLAHAMLVGRGMQQLLVSRHRPRGLALRRVGAATAGVVRHKSLPTPNFGISDPTPFGLLGLRHIPERHPHFGQSSVQDESANAKLLCQLKKRIASLIPRGNNVDVEDRDFFGKADGFSHRARLHSAIDESPADAVALHAHFTAEGIEGLTSEITADEIVFVKRFHYDGPVYDLQTDVGYYLSNCTAEVNRGIVISNCL